MPKIIYILYYSQSSNVKSIADKIIEIFSSLNSKNVDIKPMEAEEIDFDVLKDADGYIIGTPNYFSAPSGYIKVFYDEMFQEEKIIGKPVFCFISHGGSGDMKQMITLNNWLKLKTIGPSIVVRSGNISSNNIQNIENNLKEMLKQL